MKFNEIQQKLKAPKNQFNSFGNYSYRSAEEKRAKITDKEEAEVLG